MQPLVTPAKAVRNFNTLIPSAFILRLVTLHCDCTSTCAEVGHNFGAIHAFDYCGKDGWGDNTPVDYCKQSDNGCSQPNGYGFVPKCSSTPSAFGGGGGTIMSECPLSRSS